MLAYFPTPYPDELLLSVLARLADTMQYPRPSDLSEAIYGQNVVSIAADLPNRLADLVAALPPGHALTVDRLIDEHTLYPFYQPFLPAERAAKVRELMRGNETRTGIYSCIATIFSRLGPMPKFLRFCPECVQQDRQLYGQCYWHRLHQAPGVYICPNHQTLLQDSLDPMYYRDPRHRYRSAEQVLQKIEPHPNDLPSTIRPTLLQVARDVEWLLQHRNPNMTPTSLSSRFHHVLTDQGLASYSGIVSVSKFLTAFRGHYPPELLHFLECALDYDNQCAWPQQVVKNLNRTALQPLHCLLIIRFLGYTAASFFALPPQVSHFGQEPWPCLNPVCEHHRAAVIAKYQLDYASQAKPRGTFVCPHCGFIYRRIGPDTNREDRFRLDRIMSRGPVWENHLRQAWAAPAAKRLRLAIQFKIGPATVDNYVGSVSPKFQLEYRELWLAGLEQQPQAQLSDLLRNPVLAYLQQWLVQNDEEWYVAHQPQEQVRPGPPKPKPYNQVRVSQPASYWVNRDGQLAEEIRLAALYLRQQPGQPIKLTRAAIWRQLGRPYRRYQPDKFPLIGQTFKHVLDSRLAFTIRRLEWAVQNYRAEGIQPTPGTLLRRAGAYLFTQPQDQEFGLRVLTQLEVQTDEQHPSLCHSLLPSVRPDWPTFDADLAERVKVVARKLKAQPDYPIRVTAVTISVELGQLEVISCHLEMLPQTEASLAETSETPEDFATRVLTWTMAHDPDVQRYRHRAQFVRQTGLQTYAEIPAVSHLVDEALARLKAQQQLAEQDVIDWAARDEKMARAITEVAAQLKRQTDPFARITRKAICQIIDQNPPLEVLARSLLPFCRTKLPQANQVFEAVEESWEQFQLRRLAYVAEQFRQQSQQPTKNQLLTAAGISLYLAMAPPLVQQTVQDILDSLASFPSDLELAIKGRWEALDAELCDLIEPAAQELRACTDPFVRISKAALGQHLNHFRDIKANLDTLPRTAEIVARVVETREEFSIRRIRWFGADYLQRQLRPPSRTCFINQVGVAYVASRPHIRALISEVLASLSSFPVDPDLV